MKYQTGGTMTSEGWIPHRQRYGITHPVRLEFPVNPTLRTLMCPLPPMRIAGQLVWATPGGSWFKDKE